MSLSTRPRGIYEGAFASRNPYASLPGSLTAGANDLAMGRFGWADASGIVNNAYAPNANLGLVIPRGGLWSAVYRQNGVRYLRKGKGVTLATSGDFWVRFPNGAIDGSLVYADPATGIAYGADGGGFTPTSWRVTTYAHAGCLAIISPYQHLG